MAYYTVRRFGGAPGGTCHPAFSDTEDGIVAGLSGAVWRAFLEMLGEDAFAAAWAQGRGLEEMAVVTDEGIEWLTEPQRALPLLI